MKNLFLLGVLVVGLLGCSSQQRGETCFQGWKFAVVAEKFGTNTRYLWLDPIHDADNKPVPCPETQ